MLVKGHDGDKARDKVAGTTLVNLKSEPRTCRLQLAGQGTSTDVKDSSSAVVQTDFKFDSSSIVENYVLAQ